MTPPRSKRFHFGLLPILTSLLLTSCSNTDGRNNAEPKSTDTWTIDRVVDGDTVWATNQSGDDYKVRLIGIDTPEAGECGFDEAKLALADLIDNQAVVLESGASSGVDKYGRLLRYVDVAGVDAGLELIKSGFAVAKYDSRDGYGPHDREERYISSDMALEDLC